MESSINLGGQELQLLQQMKSLNQMGWQTVLFCKPKSRISEIALSQELNVEHFRFRNAIDFSSILPIILRLSSIKPRAVILHSGHDAIVGSISIKIASLFSRFRSKAIRMRTYQPNIPNAFPYNYLFNMTYTPSEYLMQVILQNKRVQKSKVGVLYPGIDFHHLDRAIKTIPHLSLWLSLHPGPVISHGAMLRSEKGHHIILDALPTILKNHPKVRYIIAGEGPEKASILEKIKLLRLEKHVFLTGMISSIADLLKVTDLSILPSTYEPLGMFQIESQYLKIPTIASMTGGIVETMLDQSTGLLVKGDDSKDWATSIIWALDHLPLMKEWATNGSSFVKNKFSATENVNSLIRIINA